MSTILISACPPPSILCHASHPHKMGCNESQKHMVELVLQCIAIVTVMGECEGSVKNVR